MEYPNAVRETLEAAAKDALLFKVTVSSAINPSQVFVRLSNSNKEYIAALAFADGAYTGKMVRITQY